MDKRNCKDYAVITFWGRNAQGKLMAKDPMTVKNPLYRSTNNDTDFQEIMFPSTNIQYPFFFSTNADQQE